MMDTTPGNDSATSSAFGMDSSRGNTLWYAVLLAVLLVLNFLIWQKESTLADGRLVLLELAPVDPRSLIQGDYMVLRYKALEDMTRETGDQLPRTGTAIFKQDDTGVAQYLHLDTGNSLANDQLRLKYKVRGQARIGAESFFFEEGQADRFSKARYGALRVAPDGSSVLVGLRGEDRAPL